MKTAIPLPVLALPVLTLLALLSSCNLIGGLIKVAAPFAGIKMAMACIPQHTLIDTPSGPRAIETLEAGDTVTGYHGQPVRILQKHSYLENPKTVFLRLTFANGAVVDLCGRHRLTGLQARDLKPGQSIDGQTLTAITSRTGETHSYDLLTEDPGYQIHGIPVNSMIEEMHAAAAGMKTAGAE